VIGMVFPFGEFQLGSSAVRIEDTISLRTESVAPRSGGKYRDTWKITCYAYR